MNTSIIKSQDFSFAYQIYSRYLYDSLPVQGVPGIFLKQIRFDAANPAPEMGEVGKGSERESTLS